MGDEPPRKCCTLHWRHGQPGFRASPKDVFHVGPPFVLHKIVYFPLEQITAEVLAQIGEREGRGGKAGERQVNNCRYVYQNTAGGSGFNHITTIWGREMQ